METGQEKYHQIPKCDLGFRAADRIDTEQFTQTLRLFWSKSGPKSWDWVWNSVAGLGLRGVFCHRACCFGSRA